MTNVVNISFRMIIVKLSNLVCLVLYYSVTILQIATALSIWIMLLKCYVVQIATGIPEKFVQWKVFAGLNQVSASLNRFKPHVWQKQVFAGRNPTLWTTTLSVLHQAQWLALWFVSWRGRMDVTVFVWLSITATWINSQLMTRIPYQISKASTRVCPKAQWYLSQIVNKGIGNSKFKNLTDG